MTNKTKKIIEKLKESIHKIEMRDISTFKFNLVVGRCAKDLMEEQRRILILGEDDETRSN
jgi:hypothetical protein